MSELNALFASALPQETKDVIRKLQSRIGQLENECKGYTAAFHRVNKAANEAEAWIADITPKLNNFGLVEGLDYERYGAEGEGRNPN